MAEFVAGHGAVANSRYVEGASHLRRTTDPADSAYHPYISWWGLADLVEAEAATGHADSARQHLGELESVARTVSGSLLQAHAAYARPLVARDEDAEALFSVALDRDLVHWPGLRARLQLRYGQWLRRRRRAAHSRRPLRAAKDGLEALDHAELADQARQELRASGETTRPGGLTSWDQLTPRELQIAAMAAEGLSNRQIGAELFISPRTVGYHLYRIFPKLGIVSRAQLHAAISARLPSDHRR
jgi:DNA-binding CsgD family transcriptional regulator